MVAELYAKQFWVFFDKIVGQVPGKRCLKKLEGLKVEDNAENLWESYSSVMLDTSKNIYYIIDFVGC